MRTSLPGALEVHDFILGQVATPLHGVSHGVGPEAVTATVIAYEPLWPIPVGHEPLWNASRSHRGHREQVTRSGARICQRRHEPREQTT